MSCPREVASKPATASPLFTGRCWSSCLSWRGTLAFLLLIDWHTEKLTKLLWMTGCPAKAPTALHCLQRCPACMVPDLSDRSTRRYPLGGAWLPSFSGSTLQTNEQFPENYTWNLLRTFILCKQGPYPTLKFCPVPFLIFVFFFVFNAPHCNHEIGTVPHSLSSELERLALCAPNLAQPFCFLGWVSVRPKKQAAFAKISVPSPKCLPAL